MKIGIIAAMEEEQRLLLERMNIDQRIQIAQWECVVGTLGQHEVVLIQSGIGKVMSAVAATLLLEQFRVELVINTGSAGGLQSQLEIGDVVIANALVYSDVDVTAFGYAYGQLPQMPERFLLDDSWIELVRRAATATGLTAHVGLIATADTFIHTKTMRDQLIEHFPDVLATEMEGAAIGQVCQLFEVPCVVIRAISDVPERGDSAVTFDEFIVEAGRKSAEMVCLYIEHL